MNNIEYILDFIDLYSGQTIITVSGKQAKNILKHSELLRNILRDDSSDTSLEIQNQQETIFKKLAIPVAFPHGREETFKKILRGNTLGEYVLKVKSPNKYGNINYDVVVEFDPLSPEEEKMIKDLPEKTKKGSSFQKLIYIDDHFPGPVFGRVQVERAKAIRDILRFFMFDPAFVTSLIKIRPLSEEDQFRRNYGTREYGKHIIDRYKMYGNQFDILNNKNLAVLNELPYLNEDTIQNLVEKHKNYLFGLYDPNLRRSSKLKTLMTRKNVDKRQAIFTGYKEGANKKLSARERAARRRLTRRTGSNNNNVNRAYQNLENIESNLRDPSYYYNRSPYNVRYLNDTDFAAFQNIPIDKMSSIEFETYLRRLAREQEAYNEAYRSAFHENGEGSSERNV